MVIGFRPVADRCGHLAVRSHELDFLDAQQRATRLVTETVLKGALRVPLAQVDVDRFGIASLDKRGEARVPPRGTRGADNSGVGGGPGG